MTSYVIGASMVRMGKYPESTYAGLAAPAALAAIKCSGIEVGGISALMCGHSFGGMLVGQRVMQRIGLSGIPVMNVENACSGGASALRLAHQAVDRGEYEAVLVVGVDKLTQFGGSTLPLVTEDVEVQRGMVMPALYAMRARRFLYERDATLEDLAAVSVKARRHGAANPYAQLRAEVDIAQVLASRPIADPLTLLQCCPTGDGAAALVVASERLWRKLHVPALRIRASVLHSGGFTAGFRDMLHPQITYQSAEEAYAQSAVDPKDLDMVELHDAFSVAEFVYYEALRLCDQGKATDFLRSGASTFGGRVVVNPSGGLLAKGHPVGASGVAQVVEAFWQLLGLAGSRQIEGAKLALTHVTGGGIAGFDHGACAIHIFEEAQQ